MSKMDDYLNVKRLSDKFTEFANKAQDAHLTDKFGVDLRVERSWAGRFGSSSVYSWGTEIENEIVSQIELELRGIVKRAALRVEEQVRVAAKAAADEAREILKVVEEAEESKR